MRPDAYGDIWVRFFAIAHPIATQNPETDISKPFQNFEIFKHNHYSCIYYGICKCIDIEYS